MILDLDEISRTIKKIQDKYKQPEKIVPPAENLTKSIDDQVNDEMDEENITRQKEDGRFITKAYKYLRKLGYVDNQYQFSEQFLNKNKYYYGMILCEARHPSIDAVHNLVRNISDLNDGIEKRVYLDRLYEEGQKIITQRLFRYF